MEETTARGGRRRLSQAIALALGLTAMTAAMSQTTAFDVPGQEAATAIPEFARQAGLQIIAPADKLKGVKTQSLHGAIDTRAALETVVGGHRTHRSLGRRAHHQPAIFRVGREHHFKADAGGRLRPARCRIRHIR